MKRFSPYFWIVSNPCFAVLGVEAQTQTVWRQSNKYAIPRIVFVNKMDKTGADFQRCIQSIESKLHTVALPVQMPIRTERGFIGVVDLIGMRKLTWDTTASEASLGKEFETTQLDSGDELYGEAMRWRVRLVETLAQANEEFAELLLDKYEMRYEGFDDNVLLEMYVRLANLQGGRVTPVLCGSSFKNVCVQPMMDAVVKYLPDPEESSKNKHSKYFGDDFNGKNF